MTLLFDENISYRIIKKIQNDFPGCIHVTDIAPSVKGDMKIFQFAKRNNFFIVTYDEDFYELQLLNGFPPKIIWLRFGNTSTLNVLSKLLDKRQEIVSFFESNELGILEIY